MRRLIFSRTPAALQYGSPASSAWRSIAIHLMACLTLPSRQAWRCVQILMQQSLQRDACCTDSFHTGKGVKHFII